MAKRTSVYLPDDLAEALQASGKPLAELIRLGLDKPPAHYCVGEKIADALVSAGYRMTTQARLDRLAELEARAASGNGRPVMPSGNGRLR